MKRLFDVVASAVALAVSSPLLCLIAVLIRVDSPGPIFYRGVRVGRGGTPFRTFKFRTMIADAEFVSPVVSTPDDDPRITQLGRVLRRHHLDELPQLIDVLRGTMSLVGPRPEVPQYAALLTPEERIVLSVRPGMTDWATLWIGDKGRLLSGAADPEAVYLKEIRPGKVKRQIDYVMNRSFWVDIEIIVRTISRQVIGRLV